MPDLIAAPLDPMATTGAQMAVALNQAYPDPLELEPYEVFALLEGLADETKRVKEQWKIALGPTGVGGGIAGGVIGGIVPLSQVDVSVIPTINADLARWEKRLWYYLQQTSHALEYGQGDVDLAGRSDYYKKVTGPLIAGECFGEPSCSDTLAAQSYPYSVHQLPAATHIFIIETMMGEAKNVALNRTYTMLAAVAETASEYGEALKDVLVDLSEAVGESVGEMIGAGARGVSTGLGDAATKLLWGLGAIVGIGGLIWIGGKAAASTAGAKK